jgi:hypothetical protein
MRLSVILSLDALILVSGCTGSPSTLALQPNFAVATSDGPANVSIRGTPPGMTYSNFQHAVRAEMQSAMTENQQTHPTIASTPVRRIVWHVYPIAPRGASRLVVNVFDGSVPFIHAQQVIDNSAPPSTVVFAVRTLTARLDAELGRQEAKQHQSDQAPHVG